jgi:death-on-curing protein
MPRYLTVAEVIELHRSILERMGERLEPLRDAGLLESALMRAQTAAYYEDADPVTQAVLMAVGISQNQPFVDGNKRAGFVTFDVFLRINGLAFQGDGLELAKRIVRVAESRGDRADSVAELVAWLGPNIEPTVRSE